MSIFLAVCSVFGLFFGGYFAVIAILGLLHGKKTKKTAAPRHKIAALVAARNEESVIPQLVESLRRQRYPAELSGIFVAVNNCTDNTARAAQAAGAQVIFCEGEIRSKGDALRFAFSRLLQTDYDAFVILDADNLADPDFFAQVNTALCDGYRIAQGYRDSKNPSDSWVAGGTSVFYWFMSSLYNRARSALGMSCALNGTGFMVSADLLRKTGWNTSTLTEDLEFSAQCALQGEKIGWMEYARVYDEQPLSLKDSMIQRRRWFAGSLQCFMKYFPRLIKKHSSHSLDMALLFSGGALQLLGLVSMVLGPIVTIQTLGFLNSLLVGAVGGAALIFALAAGAWLICLLEKKTFPGRKITVWTFWLYLVTWMIANISVFFTGIPQWKMIAHKPAENLDEMLSK